MKRIFTFAMIALLSVSLVACAQARNQKPVISGAVDVEIDQGDPFNPRTGVTATDPEDGDLTAEIKITGWDEESSTSDAGTYSITYTVTDSKGLSDTVTILLTINSEIVDAKPPVFSGVVRNQDFYIGSGTWAPLTGITATDEVDGDLTEDIEVLTTGGSFYDLEFPGTYTVKIRVRNSLGIIANETITLVVHGSPIPTTIPKSKVTVTMAHAMGQANKALLEKYAASFKAYYAENGGYDFNVVIEDGKGNYDTLKTEMMYAITAGTIPNLVQGYPDHVAEYLAGKAVVNLTPYIYNETWGLNGADALGDIIESYRAENSQYDTTGTFYSLPFNKSTEVMIYNKTVLDSLGLTAPATWQDIIEMAPALQGWATTNNIQNFAPAAIDSTGNGFITFTRQFGGSYTAINFTNFQGQYLWKNDTQTFAAMEFLKANKNIITLPEFWDQQYASTPFLNQETLITIGSSAGVRYNIPPAGKFEIGVGTVPYNRDFPDNKAAIQQGTNVSVLNAGGENEKFVSWLFLKWLIKTENTIDWAMETGYLPVRTSAYLDPVYQEFLNNPTAAQKPISMAANAAYAQSGYFFYDPAFIGSSRARNAVGSALERIMMGDGKIQEALDAAHRTASLGQ